MRALARIALTLALTAALAPGASVAAEKISGIVERVTPDGLIVDSSLVFLEKGGRIKGDVKKISGARIGYWAEAKGRWRDRGDFKASYIKMKKNPPGVSYSERLNGMSQKESSKLNKSDKIYRDPAVNEYVNGLGQSLVPEYAGDRFEFSFHVIEDPSLNAFAFPNGAIYVHTGLMARLDNEAQLATVIGHEISHVTQLHGQRRYKSMMAWSIPAQIGAIVIGAEVNRRTDNPVYSAMAGLGLSLGLSAAVNGYGRKLEDQADRVGLRYMVEEGYEPREGPRVWDTFTDVYGDQSKTENFFWGNHSTNEVRKKNLKTEIRAHYGSGHDEEAGKPRPVKVAASPAIKTLEYQNTMLGVTRTNAIQDFKLERYRLAEKGFDRVLRRRPGDAVAYHYKGRIYLATIEDKNDARSRALAAYLKSLSLDPGYAEVNRDLGLLYADMGRSADARSHMNRYLDLAPEDAEDRKKIQKALRNLT
jgi:predicted Zn-dependent protease